MAERLVVVGGGAAGLLAAARSGSLGAGVLVVEASREAGRKVLISGGGRCNILPRVEAPDRFVSSSPARLTERFLSRWPLPAQREFFEALLGAPLAQDPGTGKLFPPSGGARRVRDELVAAANRAGARILTGARVVSVTREAPGRFVLSLEGAAPLVAEAVLLASGGLSVLGRGADGVGLVVAASLGHTVHPTFPALVPLVADPPPHASLAGLSVEARVTAVSEVEKSTSDGGFLFTHRGWSGPAVLDVSHVVARGVAEGRRARVSAALGVGRAEAVPHWDSILSHASGSLRTFLRRRFPDRLVDLILSEAVVRDVPLHRLSREERRRVVGVLLAFPVPCTSTEGYRTAEATGGGVALEEVDAGSGESRLVPGLFFAGEMLDAFGPIGGYNFQWAWATGWTAGAGAARRLAAGCGASRLSP